MSDPRKIVDNEGIGFRAETFKFDSSIVYDITKKGGSVQAENGLAVTTNGNGQVGLVGDAERVLGKLIGTEQDGFCTVQIEGGCTLPGGTGAALTAGSRIVGALLAGAKGYIRNAAATDAEEAVSAHEIFDASVSTAVKVNLGR
jgi:hypothetical protein